MLSLHQGNFSYLSLAPAFLLREKKPVGILLQINQIGVILHKRAIKAFSPHFSGESNFDTLLMFAELVISYEIIAFPSR